MNKDKVFVIIPAYNEADRIRLVIEALLRYDYSLVVVDDGSKDKTVEICRGYPIVVLQHKINRGQGAALQTGTRYALLEGAQIVVHFDADGQFLAQEIESIIEPILSDQAEIVLGSRFLGQSNNLPYFKEKIILPFARRINFFLTGLKLTDAHCGFRAMNRLAAQKIKIIQDRMSHNTEIVAQIKKYNLKFKEMPVTIIYNEFGQGISGGFKILSDWFLDKLVKN